MDFRCRCVYEKISMVTCLIKQSVFVGQIDDPQLCKAESWRLKFKAESVITAGDRSMKPSNRLSRTLSCSTSCFHKSPRSLSTKPPPWIYPTIRRPTKWRITPQYHWQIAKTYTTNSSYQRCSAFVMVGFTDWLPDTPFSPLNDKALEVLFCILINLHCRPILSPKSKSLSSRRLSPYS